MERRHFAGRAVAVVTALAALLIGTMVLVAPARAASSSTSGVRDSAILPETFVGTASDTAFAAAPAQQAAMLATMQQSGIRIVRQGFYWNQIEPQEGAFDFSRYDPFVLAAARDGITVLPVLFGETSWGTSRPAESTAKGTYPPADDGQFAAFAQAVAERYGPGGSLWSENPGVTPVPITSYQIWNEPNLTLNWPAGVDPAAYASLVEAAGSAIRDASPSARIVLAGMPPASHLGMKETTFLSGMYAAGAKGSFDTVATNVYPRSIASLVASLKQIRATVDANGDESANLWVTELGWAVGGPSSGHTVTASQQAALVSGAATAFLQNRQTLRLQGYIYYGWQDLAPYAGRSDYWGLHTGLYDINGNPKPAAAAFRSTALRIVATRSAQLRGAATTTTKDNA